MAKKAVKKKTKKTTHKTSRLNTKDIWPQERDYMSRPERYKYLRRVVTTDECVFCGVREQGPSFESLCLYKSDRAMVVLNKYPYNTGHLLVLPTRHCGDLTQLDEEEFREVTDLLRRTMAIVMKEYKCSGMNVGLNHGKVAGAGIPDHLHWHIVPRWAGDTNFFPLIGETKVIPETLEQTYSRLLPYF